MAQTMRIPGGNREAGRPDRNVLEIPSSGLACAKIGAGRRTIPGAMVQTMPDRPGPVPANRGTDFPHAAPPPPAQIRFSEIATHCATTKAAHAGLEKWGAEFRSELATALMDGRFDERWRSMVLYLAPDDPASSGMANVLRTMRPCRIRETAPARDNGRWPRWLRRQKLV